MLIPVQAVHRAAMAIQSRSDISQCVFEDEYHCRIGLSPDAVTHYHLEFDSEEYASLFLLRWM